MVDAWGWRTLKVWFLQPRVRAFLGLLSWSIQGPVRSIQEEQSGRLSVGDGSEEWGPEQHKVALVTLLMVAAMKYVCVVLGVQGANLWEKEVGCR